MEYSLFGGFVGNKKKDPAPQHRDRRVDIRKNKVRGVLRSEHPSYFILELIAWSG